MRLHTANPFAGLDAIVERDVPLAPFTWYRVGGPAKYFVRPRTEEELQQAAARCEEHGIRVHVLGLGANLLVSDAGVDGAVFRLDQEEFRRVLLHADGRVAAGAGVDVQKLVLRAARESLAGLECMAGIPGTVGGAVRMNAGGKFGDIGSRVVAVRVMTGDGTTFDRVKDDLVFEYRHTNIVAPFILGATLTLDPDDADRVAKRTKEIWMYKRNSQPLNAKSAGCMFKNPRGLSAGALIDQAGLKGLRVGGAEVSDKHANFVLAHPGTRADDILRIVKLIQERVADKHGVQLETEVRVWSGESEV